MGCCGEREKFGDLRIEQKWEYINLDDFKSTSCWTPFAYVYLLIMFIVSISVYAVDTFTAVNLLAFDKWAGQIQPAIEFSISRWIFAGCIILSFVLLAYRWLRAIKVMRQGGVARSYLDPLAVRIQSIRWGKAKGWKRFLVFAELTKSRKGADYVALFTYFSFEAWLRIVFAEGPRQVINALTLYSVMQLKLIPEGEHAAPEGQSPVAQFFVNIRVLAEEDNLQAVILFGMLWTLVIWVLSALSLIVSVVLYLLFLWHHIPTQDGTLTRYCRNKINRRMERVVKVKVDKALKKENELRAREEAKAARDGLEVKKQPTLPNIGAADTDPFPGLSRQTTMATLPEYTSRPGSAPGTADANEPVPTLPSLPDLSRPVGTQRTVTHGSAASWSSYRSDAPLIAGADDMGYSLDRTQTPLSGAESAGGWFGKPIVNLAGLPTHMQQRPPTAQSTRNGSGPYQMDSLPPRPGTAMSNSSRRHPSDSGSAFGHPDQRSSSSLSQRQNSLGSLDNVSDPMGRRTPGAAMAPSFSAIAEERGRISPAPTYRSAEPSYRPRAPSRGPSDRSYPLPGGMPSERSFTPGGFAAPERSYTPSGMPPPRSMTPSRGPSPPGADPATTAGGYVAYSADRSGTPGPSMPTATIRAVEPSRTYSPSPFGQPTPALYKGPSAYSHRPGPPQRQGTGNSGVDDIIDHY